jgi:glycosyltransferase involved in cell wall biosynthesis
MRILQLCPKPPRPSLDGGCLAMDAITRGFVAQGHNVKMLVVSTEKHPFNIEELDSDYIKSTAIEAVSIDTALNPTDALKNMVQGKSYHIARFYSKDFINKLEEILSNSQFDIIFVESLFLSSYAPIIRAHSNAKIILRAHNVEHSIWEGLADEAPKGLKKWYLYKLAAQLKKYESTKVNGLDALITITDEDADTFRNLGATLPIHTAPVGMDFSSSVDASTKEVNHVFHFGSMDWKPNIQGVEWLTQEVWPIVRRSISDAKLILAGRNMPDSFRSDPGKGIEVLGEIKSASEFFKRPGIMTIPIHSGSGMRVKAIEGMSAGLPTVSTTIGICGLDLAHGKHALIADSAEDFSTALIDLLRDTELANQLAISGKNHIQKKFSNRLIISDLTEFLDAIKP